jgi:hypothetical protein
LTAWTGAPAGDVNGDGLDDLIVGAWGVTLNDKIDIGKSYVIFGKTNSTFLNPKFGIDIGIGIGITMSVNIISDAINSFING